VRLHELIPGPAFDPRPLARLVPAGAPRPAQVQRPASVVRGQAYVPVPGAKGEPGSVAGTLDWTQITGRPTARAQAVAITLAGTQSILLTHSPLPGTLAVYWNGVRQFDLWDLILDGNHLIVPASWPLVAGDTLGFSYQS
jgi:hypothetical protein